ncbi:MAG: DUF1501 domain-containing protein [Pirellulales bacterium]|nr:DUF1501 domain-containing protein [Pirellulales bacterium]
MIHKNVLRDIALRDTRRVLLGKLGTGIGSAALAALLNPRLLSAASPRFKQQAVVDPLHFPAKAKRVIFLCQAGGMSHLETFDDKPKLAAMDGQPMPKSVTQGQPIAQLQGENLSCLGPQHPFLRCGKSGQRISSIFPHLARVADELCIINSVQTEQINHDPAHTFMNTGTQISGRPAMGAWLTYGLGSEAENLPGFVVLTSAGGGQGQPIAARQWHSGFLPSRFQGVQFRSAGDPVLYLADPPGVNRERQRRTIDAVNRLNGIYDETIEDPEIATRIAQYELAFQMQTSVPELMDFAGETQDTLDMYGTKGADGTYAANCLLARRLAERGVRFIQLYHRGWDHHGDIKGGAQETARLVDQGTGALIKDLKQRGMLDETLIVFAGEFGRTPMAQGDGRDHHIRGFSMFLCGGGIKPGFRYGATDDLGYLAVENVFHVHDLHATMLSLMGIDHKRLTYQYRGRDFRLTDVHGNVVEAILS